MNEPNLPSEAPARRVRRSREELESLVKGNEAQAVTRGMSVVSLAVIGIGVLAAVIWLLAPHQGPVVDRVASAPDEAALVQQRLEAQRERSKKMQAAGDYFERTAAAEAAMLQDLGANAERVARTVDAHTSSRATPPQEFAAGHAGAPSGLKAEPKTERRAEPKPEPSRASAPEASGNATASPRPSESAPVEVAKAAPVAPAVAADCRIYVSELSSSGKLTYDDIAHMKGARVDPKSGHAFTPPIDLKERTVVFEVSPNGCVTIARSTLTR